MGEGEYISHLQIIFRRQFLTDEDFIFIRPPDMAARGQNTFLIQKHISQLGIPHSSHLAHIAGRVVTGSRQKMDLLALSIAIVFRIVGFYPAPGSIHNLVNTLLRNGWYRPLTDRSALKNHLLIGADIKGRADIGTQILRCLFRTV